MAFSVNYLKGSIRKIAKELENPQPLMSGLLGKFHLIAQ